MDGIGSFLLLVLFLAVALPWILGWVWALSSATRYQSELLRATGYSYGIVLLLLVAVPPVGVLIYGLVVRPALAKHRRAALRA